MNDSQVQNFNQDPGFFYKPKNIQWFLRFFYGLCTLVVVLDFVVHRHTVTDIEKIPAFYAAYGFIACVILVLLATQMRKLVLRSEDYYRKQTSQNNPQDNLQGNPQENSQDKNTQTHKEEQA